MNKLIDIGVNLTNSAFDNKLEKTIEEAITVGVNTLIVTGTNIESSEQAIKLCEAFPDNLYCTAGIHPHDAKTFSKDSLTALSDMTDHEKVKAIGETGLDFNRNYSTPEQQQHSFEQHIELAITKNMPLFLHQRDSHQRQYEILKHYRNQICDLVIHCFTDGKKELFDYLDLDCHIGLTGWICDERRGQHLLELAKNIPLNRLMLETDAPYLLPRTIKPKPKSRTNKPKYLPFVLTTVAESLEKTEQEVAEATTATAQHFFRL